MTPSAGRSAPHDPETLRRRRCDAGLSQTELDQAIGKSRGYVSALERGVSGASADALARIAQALGCTVADLRRGGPAWEVLPLLARAALDGRLHICPACATGLLRVLAPDLTAEDDDHVATRWDELLDAAAAGRDLTPLLDALTGTDPQEFC